MLYSPSSKSWGIVCTSKGATAALQAFIAHHIAIGALEIIVFDDGCAYDDTLLSVPNKSVRIIKCNNAYWKVNGGRPLDHRVRQIINANIALPMMSSDYVVHLDSDEFLYSPNLTVSDHLSKKQDDVPLRIPPCEPLYTKIPDSLEDVYGALRFKKCLPSGEIGRAASRELYGTIGDTLQRGMQGHRVGKAIFPRGNNLKLAIHGGTSNVSDPAFDRNHDMVICHFFASGLQDWISKLERRVAPPRFQKEKPIRRRFLEQYMRAKNQGSAATLKLFEDLNLYTDAKALVLGKHDALLEPILNIAESTRSVFGERAADLASPFVAPTFNMRMESSTGLRGIVEQPASRKRTTKITIPDSPHMPEEAVRLLKHCMASSKVYLEFGAGGSTVLAACNDIPLVISVDSDRVFLQAIGEKVESVRHHSDIHLLFVDIGATGLWGIPKDKSAAQRWCNYCSRPWSFLSEAKRSPDLVLIDGRFRLACFFTSLLFCAPGTTILFDDYYNRRVYRLTEEILLPETKASRMAKFVVPQHLDRNRVTLALIGSVTNPR